MMRRVAVGDYAGEQLEHRVQVWARVTAERAGGVVRGCGEGMGGQ